MRGRQVSGVKRYTQTDAGIVGAAVQLAHMRPATQEPAHPQERGRSRDRPHRTGPAAVASLKRQEKRREALEQLDDIIQATTQLRQLLLARGVRRITAPHDGR